MKNYNEYMQEAIESCERLDVLLQERDNIMASGQTLRNATQLAITDEHAVMEIRKDQATLAGRHFPAGRLAGRQDASRASGQKPPADLSEGETPGKTNNDDGEIQNSPPDPPIETDDS